MKEEDLQLLAQLIFSMDDAAKELNVAYGSRDAENFKKYKVAILDLQTKINRVLWS